MENRINHCVECIRNLTDRKPEIGITLGSGLGDFVEQLTDKEEIPFSSIEGFPTPTVKGHEGKLIFGTYNGVEVVVLDGRVHYYEGYSQQETVIPVRVLKRIGVHTLMIISICLDPIHSLVKTWIPLVKDSQICQKCILKNYGRHCRKRHITKELKRNMAYI